MSRVALEFIGVNDAIQRNFDRLAAAINLPRVDATAVTGAWGTAVPGATDGTPVTIPVASDGILVASATGFVSTNIALTIQVYLNGVLVGTLTNPPNNTTNARLTLPTGMWPATFVAGENWVYFRQTSGSSATDDHGFIAAVI